MELNEAIKMRRSIGLVKQDAVEKHLIEQILESATFAPNHFRTEPWRFFVLQGDARNKLGDVFADIVRAENEDAETDEVKVKIEKAQKLPLRAPVIIAVGVEPSERKNVPVKEEYAAVSSAVQNMLLTAHSLGLGAVWRTGNTSSHPKVSEFFGLKDTGEIIALVYLGYPDMEPAPAKKTPFEQYTTWMGEA